MIIHIGFDIEHDITKIGENFAITHKFIVTRSCLLCLTATQATQYQYNIDMLIALHANRTILHPYVPTEGYRKPCIYEATSLVYELIRKLIKKVFLAFLVNCKSDVELSS